MKDKGWNRYWIRTLDKQALSRIVNYDARNESQHVREITRQALDTFPNLTEAEIETQQALSEDIEL
jgi:hypothetical protein